MEKRSRKPRELVPDEYEWDRLKVKIKNRYGAEMSNAEIRQVLSEIEEAFHSGSTKKSDR